jgi:hypothetical protein
MIHSKPGEFHLVTLDAAILAPITMNDVQGEALYGELYDILDEKLEAIRKTIAVKYPSQLVRFDWKM